MDFNGQIGIDQYQWLIASAFCFIFSISLLFRKRKKINRVIAAAIAGLLSYAIASALFVVPLFFTSNAALLQKISHLNSFFLISAFFSAVVLARFIAPQRIQPAMRIFQFIYTMVCVFALIVDNRAVNSLGVISTDGSFMFPVDSWVTAAHLLLNIGPFVLGVFLIFNAIKSSSDLSSKVSFTVLGLVMGALPLISSIELIANRSFNNQEFTNIRLPVLVILAIIGLSSVALISGSTHKKNPRVQQSSEPVDNSSIRH